MRPTERPQIVRLPSNEWERLRSVRLRALRDSPEAFETTFADAAAMPLDAWEQQAQNLATFVARVDDTDVGIVRVAPHDTLLDSRYLISMWVAPEIRRCGIGSALIAAVVDWTRSQQVSSLFLDVGEENSTAIALYASNGFVPTGETSQLASPREHVREIQMVLAL